MTKARTVLPTDIVALVTFDGRVYPNEAKPWDRLGLDDRGPHALETALEQWFSFATGKHTWVSVRGATIRGLISARKRAKKSVWEADCLINADDDESVCQSLLARMSEGVTKAGAERIFLRASADSLICDLARKSGFFPFSHETLFRLDNPDPKRTEELNLRARGRDELYPIYQLYNGATPANVRSIEGVTFREWQAALEPWGGKPRELVWEENGAIRAWIRGLSQGEGGRMALMVHPKYEEATGALIQAALRVIGERNPVFCLAPEYCASLASNLRGAGFTAVEDYVLLARRLPLMVKETAPEQVGKTIPVS